MSEVPASSTAALSLHMMLPPQEAVLLRQQRCAPQQPEATVCLAGDGVRYLLGWSISSLFAFLAETSSVSCSELSAEYMVRSHRATRSTAECGAEAQRPAPVLYSVTEAP